MKIYRDMEILEVVELMDEIVYSTSLTEIFGESLKHNYRDLTNEYPEGLKGMVCLVADDNKSFLFADTDEEECIIKVCMWAGMNDKIGFKQTMQYFKELKNLFKDIARYVRIEAECRTTTSLPIINKLDGRYKNGIHVVYRSKEHDGFVDVSMICRIED